MAFNFASGDAKPSLTKGGATPAFPSFSFAPAGATDAAAAKPLFSFAAPATATATAPTGASEKPTLAKTNTPNVFGGGAFPAFGATAAPTGFGGAAASAPATSFISTGFNAPPKTLSPAPPAVGIAVRASSPLPPGAASLFAAAALPASSLPSNPSSKASSYTSTTAAAAPAQSSFAQPPTRASTASNAITVVPSDAGGRDRDYFAENLKEHPLWSTLEQGGNFILPVQKPVEAASVNSPNKKDVPIIPSSPFESRLATSHAGTMYVLAPPSPTAPAGAKNARLFYMDLKPLKAQHLKTNREQTAAHAQAPAYRELICTPTPLPSHSHTIQLNSQATYAAVHSTNTVYLVCLASNKLEKAVMYADPSQLPIKVKAASVGSWFHQNNTTLQILQVSFHPLSDIHLLILTNDSILRVYNIKDNLNLPVREINLGQVSHTLLPGGAGTTQISRAGSRRGSNATWANSPPAGRAFSTTIQNPKPMCTAFSFGSQPATRTAAAGFEHNGWDIFSIYFLFSNGSISILCPYVPPQVSLDRRLVLDLFSGEQTRLQEMEDAINERGEDLPEHEIEQVQARLMWLTQTFGHVDDPNAPGAMDAGHFVVTRDSSAHELAQGWIQPSQFCGAQTAPPPSTALVSSSSLAAPPSLFGGGGSSGPSIHSAYPFPACHLFAFRHSGSAPPGRFFRGFLDGRLDLLLRLNPVRPFFAVPIIRGLCEEVDDIAGSTVAGSGMVPLTTNNALEELQILFGAGGAYENYSISTLLLPTDFSKLEGIEVPHVLAPATMNISTMGVSGMSGFSRAASMSPGISRGVSGMDRTPSFSRVGSRAADAGTTASPLTLFLPQYKPLIDLYDSNGLLVVATHSVRAITYGEQLEHVSDAISRGPDEAFSAVQSILSSLHSVQKPLSTMDLEEQTRKIVGCVMVNDPLMGKYLIHLSSTTNQGPVLEVLELMRPQQRSMSVKHILQAADSAITTPADSSTVVSIRTTPAPSSHSLDSNLTPFSSEISSFLSKYSKFQPPAGFPPGIVGNAGSMLNSPEALGEFLRIRKAYVETIQELTIVHQLIRSRLHVLGRFSQVQMTMFAEVEKSLVECREKQAQLDEKIKLHTEMQTHLGEAVTAISSDLSLKLTDLSPAEVAFHKQLLSIHSQALPNFAHKLAELEKKSSQIQLVQQELKQAAKVEARKGLATPDTKTAWSEAQLQAIQPIVKNQSTAITSLVQQLAELQKNMSLLRAHPALKKRNATPQKSAALQLRSPSQEQ